MFGSLCTLCFEDSLHNREYKSSIKNSTSCVGMRAIAHKYACMCTRASAYVFMRRHMCLCAYNCVCLCVHVHMVCACLHVCLYISVYVWCINLICLLLQLVLESSKIAQNFKFLDVVAYNIVHKRLSKDTYISQIKSSSLAICH